MADQGVCENRGYMAHGHASECGTSVMLYLFPQHVRKDKICKAEPKVVNAKRFPGILRCTPFQEFSDIATIGDSACATAEKGKVLVDTCIDRIAEYMEKDFT